MSYVWFPAEQLWEELGSSSSISASGGIALWAGSALRGHREPTAAELGLCLSAGGNSRIQIISFVLWISLFTMLEWNFLKRNAAFTLNLSLKLQCWFLPYKWSCFPIFFLSTRLLSMSEDVSIHYIGLNVRIGRKQVCLMKRNTILSNKAYLIAQGTAYLLWEFWLNFIII